MVLIPSVVVDVNILLLTAVGPFGGFASGEDGARSSLT